MTDEPFTYERHIRDQVCVIGVGETEYTKHGRIGKPEFQLALEAILNACDDAGIDPHRIDGFCSYSGDRNDPNRLSTALNLPHYSFGNMVYARCLLRWPQCTQLKRVAACTESYCAAIASRFIDYVRKRCIASSW